MTTEPKTDSLPGSWHQSELGKVAKWGSGGTPKANNSAYYGGNIPWAIIGDLNDGIITETANSITQLGLDESSSKLVPKGTLLIAMYGSIGKLGIAGVDLATNQAIAFATPLINVATHKFLFHYLASQKEVFLASGKGMTQQNISQTMLKTWPIPLPPVAEQEKIVEILEEQLSRLNVALASVRLVREKATQFRRSLLHAAFTGVLSNQNVTSGSLPDTWSDIPLVEVATFKNGYAYKSLDWLDEGVSVIKIANVGNGEVTLDDCSHISHELANQTSEFKVEYGDFLIALSGVTLGNCGVYRHSEISRMNQRVARIRLKPDCGVIEKILEYYFESPAAFKSIWSAAKGAAQPNISTKSMEQFRIPLAPIKEQQKLVEILDEQFSRLSSSMSIADTIENKANALRRSLLHAAFNGNLTKEWREGAHV